jgi:ABC-type multidrug transport system permease subunit
MPFFIIMCELFNGILRPHQQMPAFWKYTMYYITPFTYWIGGVLSAVLRGTPVVCKESELTLFQSPPNMTCGEYAASWLSSTSFGYLSNSESTGICGYCEYSYGDDVRFDLKLSRHMKLISAVPVWNWAGRLCHLAILWHFPCFYGFQLLDGVSACLCAICRNVAVEVIFMRTLKMALVVYILQKYPYFFLQRRRYLSRLGLPVLYSRV